MNPDPTQEHGFYIPTNVDPMDWPMEVFISRDETVYRLSDGTIHIEKESN